MSENYSALIQKLDEFIRKYYRNQLIKGSIISIALIFAAFLIFTTTEYFAYMSSLLRTVLFYSFIFASLYVLYRFIVIPLMHLNRLGKIISYHTAAQIIGKHFSDVKDKLLNALQLKEQSDLSPNNELLLAGIDQKIMELKPIPFQNAIDLNKNRKYVRYAFVPLSVFLLLLFAAPNIITKGTLRLVNHGDHFERPMPFQFNILNKELSVVQSDNFLLELEISGEQIPDQAYIVLNGNPFKLGKENKIHFQHEFKNVQENVSFQLAASGFTSKEFELTVVPNPVILNFKVKLNYPAYLQKQNEELSNTGDFIIPAGTQVEWVFNTRNTELLSFKSDEFKQELPITSERNIRIQKRFGKSASYSVHTSNKFVQSKDSMQYYITVIPDLFPAIQVDQQSDSLSDLRLYFTGLIKDDYGFSRLEFHYKIKTQNDSLPKSLLEQKQLIDIQRYSTQDQFYHYWDIGKLGVSPGDEIEYYFEVFDNDGVVGPKGQRSQIKVYKTPDIRELAEKAEQNSKAIKQDLSKNLKETKELQKKIDAANKELINKTKLEYEDKLKMEELVKQQQEMQKQIQQLENQFQKNLNQQKEFNRFNPEMLEKQEQLQDLFEKLMSDEMRKMMEEMQRMLNEQLDKQEVQNMLEKMKLDQKDLEKEMDRALELFKQLELEQKINETIESLEKLAENEKKLAEQSENNKQNSDELKKEQEKIQKEFDALKKDLKDIEKKNDNLEYPQELSDTDQEQQNADDQMNESKEQLDKNQNKKASQHQKKAADEMQKMAEKMKMQQEQSQMEQAEEDIESLRDLLENLIKYSFDQESLMQDLNQIDVNNPKYIALSQQQHKLKEDAKVIEDSLLALSKRVIQIQSTVNKELNSIKLHTGKSISLLHDRNVGMARSEQQYIMTSVNNLALILGESLDQMQQQMQQMKAGKGNCKKPNSGKPSSAADIKKLQEKLNEQMKKMKDGMEKGDGQKKPGGKNGMSEELARMAAQQEALRNELSKLNQLENKDGKGSLGNLEDIMKKMEDTERDLVNKIITQETLKRQQDILVRLLESEKAEREREMDHKRQSNENQVDYLRNPAAFEEYKKLKMREVELLKTVPPHLNPFYKNLVNSYFQELNK